MSTKYFEKHWTGNFYHAAYDSMVARGENDIFFANVVVADFTGDGIADILQQVSSNEYGKDLGSAPSKGRFLLLAGHKDGSFSDATDILPAGGTYDIASRHLLTGDVNGDGLPDIVAIGSYEDGRLIGSGNGENVAVAQVAYISNGVGHWDVVSLDNFTWGHGSEVDDFDGDGRDDIFHGGFTITDGRQSGTVVSIWHQDGSQTNTLVSGIGGSTYQLADIDGDGRNEFVTVYGISDNDHILSSGLEVHEVVNGELGPAMQSPVATPFRDEIGWAWNGDPAVIPIYKDANGHEYLSTGVPDNLKSADLDGDGKEEIIGLEGHSEIVRRDDGKIDTNLGTWTMTVMFYGWDGSALVQRTDLTLSGFAPGMPLQVQFIDFDFDGHLDLFVSRPDSGGPAPMQLFLNDGVGHFKLVRSSMLPAGLPSGHPSAAVACDINGDGLMDILIRPDGHSAAAEGWAPWGAYSEATYMGTTKFYTGPKYTDPALKGAPGFNEQYYLNTYADAAAAVAAHTYKNGLEHFLAKGKALGHLGFAANTHIFGSDENDMIKAREGHERLDGGLGKDTLWGKGGADQFVFSTKLSANNVDTIKDFAHDTDFIVLDRDIFKKIGATLDANEFYAKRGATEAHDRDDRIIYDKKTGKLYFDIDGDKDGGKDAVHFATLSNKAVPDAGDFLMI